MIEAPHYSATGAKKGAAFPLPEEFFDGTVNRPVIHEAVKAYLANQRQGTASTKTRAMVSGGNQKPWKQKGTGRARQGSIRAPQWPGGGTVFGPQPRDYRIELPKKVKQLARRGALNARAAEGSLFVVEKFEQQHPRTRELLGLLEALGVAERKVLVLTHGVSQALVLSARNLPRVDVLNYADASAYDVIWSDVVVVEEGALSGVEPAVPVREFVAVPRTEKHTTTPRVKAAKTAKPKVAKPARAEKTKKAAKPKAEKKPAAKKPAAKAAPKAKAAKKPAAKKAAPKKKGGK